MKTTNDDAPTRTPPRGALEEERDFFLRSLRDLEAEWAAGDISEDDYRALKDDYTGRAAEVLRRLENPDELPVLNPERVPKWQVTPRAWKGLAVAGVVAVAALAGWRVGASGSGSGTAHGMSAAQVERLLVNGQAVAAKDPVAALKDFRQILATYPDQPQALTDEGWVLAQAGVVAQGEADLKRAEAVAPTYDLPHAYLGYLLGDQGDPSGAITQLTFYLAHGPDPALEAEAKAALVAARAEAAKAGQAGQAKAG